MAGLPVAVAGDVHATVGATMFGSATSGGWTAAGVVETPYAWLTVGGLAVLHQATCSFAFAGKDSSNAPVAGTSSVTLTAGVTVLQHGSTFVLRDGDSAHDAYGNTLAVQAGGVLTTT